MVKVTNGSVTLTVSRGAYECLLCRRGFWLAEQANSEGIEEPQLLTDAEKAALEKRKEAEAWELQQLQKPLSTWGQKEIKKFAGIRGIKLDGIKTLKQARERIAEYI